MYLPGCVLVVLSLYADPVLTYSNGRVSVACADMVPQHGYEPQVDPSPYDVLVDTTTFSPHSNITVTLSTSASTHFKGFLMEARDAGACSTPAVNAGRCSSPAVGSFSLMDPSTTQLLTCGQTQASGVSHRSSSKKTTVQAVWMAAENPPESVQFFVTVVHNYKLYWVRLPGPVVSLKGAPASASPKTAPPVATSAPSTTSSTPLTTTFSSEGCGTTKSCLRDPAGCDPASDHYCYFLSFSADAPAGTSVTFELSGPADGYVSFALSLDKWMGNDDAYLCVRDGDAVHISPAYLTGRTNPALEPEDSLWGRAWRLSDGIIQCRFHRNILPQQENSFHLNHTYFLFLAYGKAQDGLIYRHERQPLISSDQTLITGPPRDLTSSHSPLLIKMHGVLMLCAWMVLVSTGVLVARHYKEQWTRTLLGHKPWFQVHRGLMVLAVSVTCAAFILPFVYRGGWSQRAGYHSYTGCSVMVLSIVQPVMAVFRPAPESSRRFLFNWMHLATGSAAQILAVISIFLGVTQQALLLAGGWCTCVLGGWLLWIVLTDLVLLIHSQMYRMTGPFTASSQPLLYGSGLSHRSVFFDIPFFSKVATTVGAAINYTGSGEDKESLLSHPKRHKHQGVQFKTVMLVVFLVGHAVFLGVMVTAIIQL